MLNPININLYKLKTKHLQESSVAQWAADVKYILNHVLSKPLWPVLEQEEKNNDKPPVVIKGAKEDLSAFADTINKEKEYALEYLEKGIGHPTLSDIKLELEKSIHNFEKTTGIKWPLR